MVPVPKNSKNNHLQCGLPGGARWWWWKLDHQSPSGHHGGCHASPGGTGRREPRNRGRPRANRPARGPGIRRPAPAARVDPGRDRKRQGARGPGAPPGGPPVRRALRRRQLRGHPRDPARGGDVRLRARRLHRRPPGQARDSSRPPTGARSSWTRSDSCPRVSRPSSSPCSRSAASAAWGRSQSEPVDVWIIAATNLDLQAATRARRFREDLYHRLAVLTLALPPLRERQGDILLLAEHFLARACADYGLPAKTLAPDARAALLAYRWPGNVRELMNTMERVVLLAEASLVTGDMLNLPERRRGSGRVARPVRGVGAAVARVAGVGGGRRRARAPPGGPGGDRVERHARGGPARHLAQHDPVPHREARAPPRRARAASPRSTKDPGRGSRRRGAGRAGGPGPERARRESRRPGAIRWERRRLALLQAILRSDKDAGPLDTWRSTETLLDKARSFGGRVEELGASGFVVLFGLDPVEDAVRRAAMTAVAMLRAAERTSDDSRSDIRIGIDVGSFLLGRLQDASLVDTEDKRTALGAMGALVAGAEPGTIVVSAAAAPFLARGFDLTPLAAGPGRRSAFRLGGLERGKITGGRGTRFVGRDHELDLLQSRLTAAVRGQGQVVAIAGEAGIGKSRLIGELRQGLSAQPILCLEGHCLPYTTPIPCLPLVELLRAACAIVETDGPDGVRDKLRATLDRTGMDGREATPYLLHLLEPGEGGEAFERIQPASRQGAHVRGAARAEPPAGGAGSAGARRGGSALGRPDLRGVPRDARRGRGGRADPARHDAPAGVPAALDGQVLRDAGRPAAALAAGEPEPGPGRDRPGRGRRAHRRDDRGQGRGQPVLRGGAGPGRHRGRELRAGIAGAGGPGYRRRGHHGPDRPPDRRRQARAPGGGGHRAEAALPPAPGDPGAARRGSPRAPGVGSRPPSSSTRRARPPSSSTPSSTR